MLGPPPQVRGGAQQQDAEGEGRFTENDVVEGEILRQRPGQRHVGAGEGQQRAQNAEVHRPRFGHERLTPHRLTGERDDREQPGARRDGHDGVVGVHLGPVNDEAA